MPFTINRIRYYKEVNIMKKLSKLFSLLVVVALCLAMSVPAFAADVNADTNSNRLIGCVTLRVDENGTTPISTRSSISGYGHVTINGDGQGVYINCNGEGFGGMGVTVKTTCSSGTHTIQMFGMPVMGDASIISSRNMTTNQELKFNNLWQSDLSRYFVGLTCPSGTPPFLAEVWIYG